MAMGMLSSCCQAPLTARIRNMVDGPKPGVDGHFTMAINIEAFTEVKTFRERVDNVLNDHPNEWPFAWRPATANAREIENLEHEQREHVSHSMSKRSMTSFAAARR